MRQEWQVSQQGHGTAHAVLPDTTDTPRHRAPPKFTRESGPDQCTCRLHSAGRGISGQEMPSAHTRAVGAAESDCYLFSHSSSDSVFRSLSVNTGICLDCSYPVPEHILPGQNLFDVFQKLA